MSTEKQMGTKIKEKLNPVIFGIMAVVFLPVLFCVLFVGNRMNYMEGMKLPFLLPGPVLALIALVGLAICVWFIMLGDKWKLTPKMNWIINGLLLILFVGLYFVNQRITREIAYYPPWDIMIVRGDAYKVARREALGYVPYYSSYPNNIAIMYILGRLYRIAGNMANYPYVLDFIWLQVNCILVSVGGFFSCLTVKKLSKNIVATGLTFLVYIVLAGSTGWKIAAYTDTYGMIFAVMAIYFYLTYRETKRVWLRFILIGLALFSAFIGGYIKASIYLLIVAILGVEVLDSLDCFREKWKFLLAGAVLSAVFALGTGQCTNVIADEIGLERNFEVTVGWENYLLMGQNEKTTGGYETDDVAMYSQYLENKALRRPFVKKLAFDRIAGKGVLGNLSFWIRKMTMVFNDGSFGWGVEVWPYGYYNDKMATNGRLTEALRGVYWKGPNTGRYNTLLQLAWYFVLLGFPGIFLVKKEERNRYLIMVVAFLGVFFYQMLFEARARYLFVFLPFLIAMSVCGMQQYANMVMKLIRGKSCQQK